MDKIDPIDELLQRGVANIISNKEDLKNLLKQGKKLNIYLGIDPTATQIHLGHGVPLRKLQAFAELGHNVFFLIGDFTALIGDTSDKDNERPNLTSEQIEANWQTYKKQAEKLVDFSKIKIVFNSQWLTKLGFKEVIKLCQQFSFGDFASRELIAKRLKNKQPVGLHEALYPAMQAYDSYFLNADIQIGGTDQTFNMQAGRLLQKKWKNKESFVLATDFLIGMDGKKMSKTGGNSIWIDDKPDEMFSKILSIKDELIISYATLASNLSLDEIKIWADDLKNNKNQLNIKKKLAFQIVSEMRGESVAENARENFEKVVQRKEIPTKILEIKIKEKEISLIDLLNQTNLISSKTEAKRLIEQGGVEINGLKVTDQSENIKIENDIVIKIGKRKFVKVTQ